jgi:hypothetical protein
MAKWVRVSFISRLKNCRRKHLQQPEIRFSKGKYVTHQSNVELLFLVHRKI